MPRYPLEHLVAGGVPERVVDGFEAVDIDVQRGHRGPSASCPRQHLVRPVERKHPVRQSRECVVKRLMAEFAGLLLDHPEGPLARAAEEQKQPADDRDRDCGRTEQDDRDRGHGRGAGAPDQDAPVAADAEEVVRLGAPRRRCRGPPRRPATTVVRGCDGEELTASPVVGSNRLGDHAGGIERADDPVDDRLAALGDRVERRPAAGRAVAMKSSGTYEGSAGEHDEPAVSVAVRSAGCS